MVVGEVQNGISIIQLNDRYRDGEFGRREEKRKIPPADIEDALAATGFGLYNVLLVLAAIPVAWASTFDMTTAAFILASAECDLELTFIRKGALVSVVYIGMTVSSFFWGFVADRVNRRPLMLLGLLVDALCNILCCIVESYHVFLLLKFITGTIVSGPLSLLVPYVGEFQPASCRQKFATWSGLVFNVGFIVPALLAFNITPQSWTVVLFEREYTAWRIYLMVCTIPSVVGLLTVSLMPESPKRLVDDGRVPRAYNLLRRMYAINQFKSADSYPIKSLSPAKSPGQILKTNVEKIRGTWSDIVGLCGKKYLGAFLIINFLQFGSMLGFNVMRLWVPHMFIIINNFDSTAWDWSSGNPTMCRYLSRAVIPVGPTNDTLYADHCALWRIRASVYINSTIIATSAVGFSFLFSLYYTNRLRKKFTMAFCYVIAIVSSFAANWSQLVPLMLTLSAAIVVTGRITGNIVIAVNATVIPLPLRTTAVSIITNTGNLATIIGNLLFAILLEINCLAAFFGIGCLLLLCLVTSFYTLNPPAKESKEIKT